MNDEISTFDVLDVNGDGQDDLQVGSGVSSEGGTNAGSVFVVYGPFRRSKLVQT